MRLLCLKSLLHWTFAVGSVNLCQRLDIRSGYSHVSLIFHSSFIYFCSYSVFFNSGWLSSMSTIKSPGLAEGISKSRCVDQDTEFFIATLSFNGHAAGTRSATKTYWFSSNILAFYAKLFGDSQAVGIHRHRQVGHYENQVSYFTRLFRVMWLFWY